MPETPYFQIDEYYLDLQKQGQDMEIMDQDDTRRNPFPGLRPFRTSESHLFFGREGQAEELIARLMRTHFLGVLGNSGSGKSSLVRAGLIPALHAGKKQQRIADWKIVICRPGNSPLQNLAAALAGANMNTTDARILVPQVQRLLPLLRESSFGLLEADADTKEHDKTLLIVDQFEELFRFEREIPPGEAAHFADLLLSAVQQEGAHLYVVVTMRSEFLGECVRYRGLPEIINQGQYLVPRLGSENVRRAVIGPLGVVNAPIDPTLVNRLVREVGDNMDQLPLLQHALMRTYRRWQQRNTTEAISHDDYEATGQMTGALGKHADEHYDALDNREKLVAKLLFQRLTDLSAGDKGGRRPTLVAEIYGLAGAVPADHSSVDRVIEQFRQLDTSFLMPPPGAPLREENMLDISHESLIRNWARLKAWASEEAENARMYQRLQQARLENEEDDSQGWIKGALLQRLTEWREKTPLNHFWAARYHSDHPMEHGWEYDYERFSRNMAFLDACAKSERARALEKENAIAEQARQKQRARYRNIIVALTAGAALLATSLAIGAVKQRQEAIKAKEYAVLNQHRAEIAQQQADSLRTIALHEKGLADSSAIEAIELKGVAERAFIEAAENFKRLQMEEARTKAALEQISREKFATEEQRQAALQNYKLAQAQTERAEVAAFKAHQALEAQEKALADVVHLTLVEVERLIYSLDYEAADNRMQYIMSLGVSQKEISDALLEFAFWYAETGKLDRAHAALDSACSLFGLSLPEERGTREDILYSIRRLNPARDSFLRIRYYPVMKNIPAGIDTLDKNYIVKISSFQLAETELTWWQYNLYCVATGQKTPETPGWGANGDNPVVNVSWYDAIEYLTWLSERFGLSPAYKINKNKKDPNNNSIYDNLKWIVTLQDGANGFRLPTEAEYEYAARAGKNFEYAGSDLIGEVAWYIENSGNRTRPTKGKTANGFGLYDLTGNVWEWCVDWYRNYPSYSQINPVGPLSGSRRVMRGGAWVNVAQGSRITYRGYGFPGRRDDRIGFRPARTITF